MIAHSLVFNKTFEVQSSKLIIKLFSCHDIAEKPLKLALNTNKSIKSSGVNLFLGAYASPLLKWGLTSVFYMRIKCQPAHITAKFNNYKLSY
jgi:hypothetical protein